jgi:hypothetical protein
VFLGYFQHFSPVNGNKKLIGFFLLSELLFFVDTDNNLSLCLSHGACVRAFV